MSLEPHDALSQARHLLPQWILWANLALYVLLASLGAWMCAWFASWVALRPFRKRASDDWVERARLGFPATVTSHLALLLLPISFGVGGLAYGWPFSTFQQWLLCLTGAAAAWCAASHVARRNTAKVRRIRFSFFRWCRGVLAFVLCFVPHIVCAVVLGLMLPGTMTTRAWGTLAAGTVVCIVLISGGNLWLARLLHLARPASSRLQTIVEAAVRRTGIRPRAVDQVTWNSANAVAYPAAQRIAFTELALDVLNDDEAESICVHELAHLSESRRVLLLRYVVALLVIPCAAVRPIVGSYGLAVYAVIPVTVWLAGRLFRRVSRRMEQRADEVATVHQGDEGTYARALEKIYATNAVPAVMRKGSSHPDLYDRLVAAGEQPDYPRPDPPPKQSLYAAFLLTLLLPVVLQLTWLATPPVVLSFNPSPAVLEFAAAMPGKRGTDAWIVSSLAWRRWANQDRDAALIFQQAAIETDERSPAYPADFAFMLASRGRCDDAQTALAEAERRLEVIRLLVKDERQSKRNAHPAGRVLDRESRIQFQSLEREWAAVKRAKRVVSACR